MRRLLPKMPTQDSLLQSRWTRPFAHRLGDPVLWRLNRQGVARGLMLGLFVGVMIPLVQSPFAALLAIATRSNLPIAIVATFITNPLTTPLVYIAAYQLGKFLLAAQAVNPVVDMQQTMAWLDIVLHWLTTASLPTAIGLLTMASVASALGYFGVQGWWRWRVSRKWKQRRIRRTRV